MRLTLAAIGITLLTGTVAHTQSGPFDMTPERQDLPQATPPSEPVTSPPEPNRAAPAPGEAAPIAEASPPTAARRYLLPFPDLTLPGEYARRSWSIFLTPEQAAAKATVRLGYQNAIIVAPEASRLTLAINGDRLIDAPIASPEKNSSLAVEIPAGTLHAGLNELELTASQRHRTDCSIESTYELWTQIDPAETYLSLEAAGPMRWKRVDDVRAIGADDEGATTFNLIVPSMDQAASTQLTVRLAESLALMANMPNQSFIVSDQSGSPATEGQANVVMGVASDLAGTLAMLPPGSETAPTVALVDDPALGSSTLVVTGPTWSMVQAAIDGLAHQVDRPIDVQRTSLATQLWRSPDVPMMFGATEATLADLGVTTQEFAGRRFRTDFAFGMPADFYANAYGEFTLLLDAAYSPEVLPGSHIDIYVNDNIAATVPITAYGGEILRHLPIPVTMRHFRPGENTVAIEAVLNTETDKLCAPGATGLDNGRFVIFDSSEFIMPDYARLGHTPDLAGVGGTGFPYNRLSYPIPLIIDRVQPDTLSAATTLLARLSVAAGRPIAVDTTASVASIADKNAIFVNTISQIPSTVLAQLGVGDEARSSWGETVASIRPDTQATFDDWRERLRGSGWRGQASRFQDWMDRTFNVSLDTFRLFRPATPEFTPGGNDSLLVAADANPAGTGSWTLVTAPTVGALQEGVRELTGYASWGQLNGHISTLNPVSGGLSSIPASGHAFIQTQPFSFRNYRLIAANWLSSNALSYALVLSALSILLGLATAALLATLGRKQ